MMKLLQNFRVEGADLNNSNMEAGSVNFAGTIVCSSSIDFGNLHVNISNQVLTYGSLIREHQTI